MSFHHAQNAVLLLTNRHLKKFFCRFNFFFRRFDKHLILYASVKVWKGLFETVKIQYKKRGYRIDTLFLVSVITDLLFDSQFGFHFRRQSVFVDLNIDGFIPYECFRCIEVSVVFAAIAP